MFKYFIVYWFLRNWSILIKQYIYLIQRWIINQHIIYLVGYFTLKMEILSCEMSNSWCTILTENMSVVLYVKVHCIRTLKVQNYIMKRFLVIFNFNEFVISSSFMVGKHSCFRKYAWWRFLKGTTFWFLPEFQMYFLSWQLPVM